MAKRTNIKWGAVKFDWTKNKNTIVTGKGFTPQLNKFFAQTLAEYSYDYVPYSYPEDNNYEGAPIHLADLVTIRNTRNYATIIYEKAYANVQYNGNFNHVNQAHPKATKRWCHAAWEMNKETIKRKIRAERRRLSKG